MSDHRWCPDKCPITGRPFFCWIEDEDGSQVPTYGGPFDSYTLPEQDEDGEFTVKHYDHDLGGWRDYMNLGMRLIDDQREDHEWGTVEALQTRIAEQDAAIALMRERDGFGSRPMDAIDADNGFRRYPWTYENQPGNVGAWALGEAAAKSQPGGDPIDHGLSLLRELHLRGLGIVRVPVYAAPTTTGEAQG